MKDTETEKSHKEGDCQREEHSTPGLPLALLMQKHEGREEVVTEGRCRHGRWGAAPEEEPASLGLGADRQGSTGMVWTGLRARAGEGRRWRLYLLSQT